LGKLLSGQLGYRYIDNDSESIVRAISEPGPFVASATASVIESPEVQQALSGIYSVYIYLPLEAIYQRASAGTVRRQAIVEFGLDILRDRFERRDPLYRLYSTFILESVTTPQEGVAQIIHSLKN
jgi:shikimate kinase